MHSLLGLLAGGLWVAWLGLALAPAWVLPLSIARTTVCLRGHAVLWPPALGGAPVIVRVAAACGFTMAALQMFVEPAVFPPLLGLARGAWLSAAGLVVSCALDVVSFDLLRRAPGARRRALVLALAGPVYRAAVCVTLARGLPLDPAELLFPLPLGTWRPLCLHLLPVLATGQSVLLLLAARAGDRASSSELPGLREERERRAYHLFTLTPALVLSLLTWMAGAMHTPEAAARVSRWLD